MRKIGILMVVVSAGLLLSACGSDDNSTISGTSTTAAAPPVSLAGAVNDHGTKTASSGMEVELDDFYFSPTYIKATAGEKFTVELRSEGKANHTFTIDGQVDQPVNPDEKKTVEITAPASGTLNFYCRFHKGSGMQGAIFVG